MHGEDSDSAVIRCNGGVRREPGEVLMAPDSEKDVVLEVERFFISISP